MPFVKAHRKKGHPVSRYYRAKRAAARVPSRGTFKPSRGAMLALARLRARKFRSQPTVVTRRIRARRARRGG